jgi:hypothetical protein
MNEKIINLGKKLHALAMQGSGGEKENAQRMLDAFLFKNGLTLSDIEPSIRTERLIKNVNNDNVQMLINLIASIVGSDYKMYKCRAAKYRLVEMNDIEWMEFERRWNILRVELKREMLKKKREIQKQLKLVTTAFIHKHNLFSITKTENTEPQSFPTAEEMEEIMQMIRMKNQMKDINFYKEIGN